MTLLYFNILLFFQFLVYSSCIFDIDVVYVIPKFKDKFEYNKPHVRPKNSHAHKSTNYRSIITSVLHSDYYNNEHQSGNERK